MQYNSDYHFRNIENQEIIPCKFVYVNGRDFGEQELDGVIFVISVHNKKDGTKKLECKGVQRGCKEYFKKFGEKWQRKYMRSAVEYLSNSDNTAITDDGKTVYWHTE